jgi:hypothetical protein
MGVTQLAALLLLVQLPGITAHGAIVSPRSRNSIDYLVPISGIDSCRNLTGAPCENGQAAHWYSQGCFIGCPSCDHESGRRQTDLCGLGKQPTLNDPLLRTVNRNVTAGSKLDIYRHNPWRAPGSAPIADACGLAGGTPWGGDAPEEGRYKNTTFASHGMRGTLLPPIPGYVPPVWTAGGEEEVTWQIRNNHGGGYSYRLCHNPNTNGSLAGVTEECFRKTPLSFKHDKQALVFANGSRLPIKGTFTSQGTSPEGSEWAMMPYPNGILGPRCVCSPDVNYKPGNFDCGCKVGEQRDACHTPGNCSSGACEPCPETPGSDCSRCDNGGPRSFPLPEGCDEDCYRQQPAVLDVVQVPADLAPGNYILGFRYDCEATAQVWSNCADIVVAAAGASPAASL